MKKALSLALAIAAIGLCANAQAPKECQKKDCPKGKTECVTPGEMNKMYQPREFTDFAFEGILLDVNQQARMDSLNAAMKTARTEAPACNKPCDKKDGKCDKKDGKCDKKDGKCDKKDGKCDKKDGKCDKKGPRGPKACPVACPEYMSKVKEILTPDQYVTFLENVIQFQNQQLAPRGPKAMQGPKGPQSFVGKKDIKVQQGPKGPKGDKKMHKGKAQRGQNPTVISGSAKAQPKAENQNMVEAK